MVTGVAVFICALVLALTLTPVVGRIARCAGVVDMPGARKVHCRPIPRVGGIVLVAATLVAAIPVMVIGSGFSEPAVGSMLLAAVAIFLVGLADDVTGVSPKLKFLALLTAAAAVCAVGGALDRLDLGGGYTLHLGAWGWPVTMAWIVGVTVSMNFIDGLDGLAGGIAAMACGVLVLVSLGTGHPAVALLMGGLLGALVGFLVFNFNPASIFMGDCGSMFLGFVLASSAALCAASSTSFALAALPAVALGVPLVDAVLTFIRRGLLERRSIFTAERGHIHHRLIDQGLSQRHAVVLLYVATAASIALGMVMLVTEGLRTLLVLASVGLVLAALFYWAGSLQLYSILAAIRRNLGLRRDEGRRRRDFEDVQLKLRMAKQFDVWWTDLCEAAEKMHFARMTLTLTNRNGAVRALHWQRDGADGADDHLIGVSIPVRQRRCGGPLHLQADLIGDGSLEAAGHAIAYFARLLDEHSLADLPTPHASSELVGGLLRSDAVEQLDSAD